MPPELLTRSADSRVVDVDAATRRVTVRLCRWNEPRTVNDPDATYREVFPPGSLDLADDVHVVDRHRGTLIGRAVPESFTDDGDGPTVDLLLARTAAGDDTLALIDAGVIRSVSMELEPIDQTVDADTVTRTRSRVHGVAFAFRPAHDAPILATRSTSPEETAMPEVIDPPAPELVTRESLVDALAGLVTREQFDAVVDDVRRDALIDHRRGDTGHPLARFRSLVDYADTLWAEGPANLGTLHRALADQITANNPGVIPPAWVSSVAGIIDQARPTISAFGAIGLPASGMELSWPYFDGDLTALVGEQLVEKTAIVSVRVDLKRGNEPIRTFAGGSDISYQLIRRSDPPYRDAYLRIMMNAYAITVNGAAALDATTASTPSSKTWDPAAGDLETLAMALFTASVEVSRATGAPASFVLAGETAFIAAGVLAVAAATSSGTVNPASTASAATLAVSVADLPIIFDPLLDDGVMLVSNALTAKWHEDGPFTLTAEDVEKLGQNVAVWGMGAFAASLPAGIRRIDDGVALAAAASKSSK